MTDIPVETAGGEPTAPAARPKANKKPRVGEHRPHVPPSKAKAGEKATAAKKTATRPKSAKSAKKAPVARQGSKTAKVLGLLKRSGGATLKELTKATGWQTHSVRGFLSGALGKRMRLTIRSTKTDSGERRYSVKG